MNLLVLGTLALAWMLGNAASGTAEAPTWSGQQTPQATIAQGVVGRVTDGTGRPVPGVLVRAASLDSADQPVPEIAVRTDADGRYTWPLQPGTYEIWVSVPRYARAFRSAVVRPDSIANADLVLEPAR